MDLYIWIIKFARTNIAPCLIFTSKLYKGVEGNNDMRSSTVGVGR